MISPKSDRCRYPGGYPRRNPRCLRCGNDRVVVFAGVSDPVASGLVARLDRPTGNITGFGGLEASLTAEITR
jgi:hypothetical protein